MKNRLGKIEEKPYGGWHPPLLVRPRVNQKIINIITFYFFIIRGMALLLNRSF